MRDVLRLLRTIIGALGAIAISAAIVMASYLMYRVWTDTGDIAKTAAAPFTWAGETIRVLSGAQTRPKESDPATEAEHALELAAAAISKDSEGELAQYREEVMELIFDAMLRAKEKGVSLEENFRKAHTWTPLNWDHDANVNPLTKLFAGGWVDRDMDKTLRTVPQDILSAARRIVRTRKTSDPEHCALHIIRAEAELTTPWSGEKSAQKAVRAMRPDPALSKRGYLTKFYCS